MIVIRTRTHVTRLTGEEITAFLLHPSDREYQRWWEGTHLELHPVKGSGQRIGDIVSMDELVGRRRIRLSGVLVESIPGRKITWQFKKLVKLPAWLRIPAHAEHGFRLKLNADSGRKLNTDSGHPER